MGRCCCPGRWWNHRGGIKVDLHLSDVSLWLRGYWGCAGLIGDWMILKVSSKPDASMILGEKLPQNLPASFHRAHLNSQLWESAGCDISHFFLISFPLGRSSAFPSGRGWAGSAGRSGPLWSSLRSAAALRAPGPGLCKEPSYARNADFPYVTARPVGAFPVGAGAACTLTEGKTVLGHLPLSGSALTSLLRWLFPLGFYESPASSLTCRTYPAIKMSSART